MEKSDYIKAFKQDLAELLSKYNAEIELDDIGKNYQTKYIITVNLNVFNCDTAKPIVTFSLGNYVTTDNI